MKSLRQHSVQTLVDQILRTGKEYSIPQDLIPQIQKSITKRLELKKKITKLDIRDSMKYIKYTADLKNYVKHFFDKDYYGFPLELMAGFYEFIDYAYNHKIIPKLKKSKKLFRNFEFSNKYNYQFISTHIVLHFYIVLLKYKSKIYLMLYDSEYQQLHFALPVSEDYGYDISI